jgi:hypothetical protein
MKAIRVTAGAHQYSLAHHDRLDDLRQATVAAVRGGGGLVEFTESSGGAVSLVVSPGVAIAFEVVDVPEPLTAAWRPQSPDDVSFDYGI